MEHYTNQPDITQRSIVAAARLSLAGITTPLNVIHIPVERPLTVLTREQALDGPQEWDGPSYVVTFERGESGEWVAVNVR